MKKSGKFLSLFLALLMVLTIAPITAFANEVPSESTMEDSMENSMELILVPEAENYDDNSNNTTRLPNLIPISVTARTNGTGVDVYVGNIGLDGLDSVEVTVSATGYSSPKSKTAYVPVGGKNFGFNFPMIKCSTTYNATITIVDGSGTDVKTGTATLTYSESNLENANWHKGTFSTRAASLEYHFGKHGSEVGSTNLVSYLNKANDYRSEVINDIANGNTSKYTITTGTGSIPSKKYKNKNDRRFIILTNSGYQILSFGK